MKKNSHSLCCAALALVLSVAALASAPAAGGAGPDQQKLQRAVGALTEARDAMAALLAERAAADAAKEPPVDVVLDMTEALLSYGNYLLRPPLTPAPQWRDYAGQSMSRIHAQRMEFAPGREDARFIFRRRGGQWYGPQIGMISTKFGELFHLHGCDAEALRADAKGVQGGFALKGVQGDFRYDMHFSGEGAGGHVPDFRNHDLLGFGWWPDWWVGPRERTGSWNQQFTLDATQRRGWLLSAKFELSEPMPVGERSLKGEVFAWVEDGQIRRGYVANLRTGEAKRNNPLPIVAVSRWSVKDKALQAEFHTGIGKGRQTFRLRAALADAEAGRFTGKVETIREKDAYEWRASGTLYRALAGAYEVEGPDGRWMQQLLAGVAPAPAAPVPRLAPPAAPATPAEWFARALDLYREAAALDWALREYPLPVADALANVREHADDRWKYWHIGGFEANHLDLTAAGMNDAHAALAGTLGEGGTGLVPYLDGLARIARRAVADRKVAAAPVIGLGQVIDPEFAPRTAAGDAHWSLLSDWTCFGFVPRGYCFSGGPHLPELAVAPDGKLERGKPVHFPHADPQKHLWRWRAVADPADGAVTVPIECLRLPSEERDNWGHATEKPPAGLRYLDGAYGPFATWYAAAGVQAERAHKAWLAVRAEWDGRVWINDSLVWRPSREHTPHRLAIVPVDLMAGANRIVVCVSPRPTSDGNSGKQGPWIHKYGERGMGSFAMWLNRDSQPRPAGNPTATPASPAPSGIRGRRGDGSGRYPDAKPALAWDLERGENVRWKAALPTDDAETVIVGERLFVTTYNGELACLDAASGKELWRRKPKVSGELAPYPPPAIAASFASGRRWKGGEGSKKPFPETLSTAFPAMARSCLTPLADAARAWMHDPRGRVACFDHAGNQLWAQAVPVQVPRFVCGGYVEYRAVPPTPPAIIGGRLIAAIGMGLAAFDIEKGAELWRREAIDYNGRFAAMDFGNAPCQQIIILSSCEVLDAATGKTLIPRCAPLMPDSTCEPVIEGTVAYLNACSAAVRFWTDAQGQLRHQLLWDSPTDIRKRRADQNGGRFNGANEPDFFGQSTGAFPPTPVLHNGTLFIHLAEPNSIDHGPQNLMRLNTYDAATGCAVAQRYGLLMNAMRPVSSTVLAGRYLFLADEGSVIGGHYDGFATGVPMIAVTTAEDQPRRIAESRGLATLAPPTFAGRRMYLAGSDQVVCIERPGPLGDKLSECELAALKACFFTREIGLPPTETVELAVSPLADFAAGKDVPVAKLESGKTPNRWLYAGPFFVDEKTDVFREQGGAGAARPGAGLKVAYTDTDGKPAVAVFASLDAQHVIDAKYAQALRNPRLEGGVNFATASGRKYNTTSYAYTVLDVDRPRAYRVEIHHGRVKNTDVYLAGQRLKDQAVVQLSPGRFPLMIRAAIATCGNWEPIEVAVQFRELLANKDQPPQPLAAPLPEGVRTPIAPLAVGAGLPPALLGAWPLPEGTIEKSLFGKIVGEGTKAGGVEFRPVPAEAVVSGRGGYDRHAFNAPQVAGGFALAPKALFEALPARGLFFAVLENRRSIAVELDCPKGVRLWLSGREVHDGETVRLAAGLYPMLLELRATAATAAAAVLPLFREVSDRHAEMGSWLARVRKNESLLRVIAASGPGGAYAQAALDSLRREGAVEDKKSR